MSLGETIRIFRRSRSGHPMAVAPGGGQSVGDGNSTATHTNGDEEDEMHSSKHFENLPAPDTSAAAKEAASK